MSETYPYPFVVVNEYLALKPLATTVRTRDDIIGFHPEYKGTGWYHADDWWIYIIEDGEQCCVIEWNFDPRPFLAKIAGAAVHVTS